MGPQTEECWHPLEAGKGKLIDAPLKLPEGMKPCQCLILDFWPLDLKENNSILFYKATKFMAIFIAVIRNKHTCIGRNIYQSHLRGYLWGRRTGEQRMIGGDRIKQVRWLVHQWKHCYNLNKKITLSLCRKDPAKTNRSRSLWCVENRLYALIGMADTLSIGSFKDFWYKTSLLCVSPKIYPR